jgi:hypothetical protein
MAHKENEEIQNQLSKLDSEIKKLKDRTMKQAYLMNNQI